MLNKIKEALDVKKGLAALSLELRQQQAAVKLLSDSLVALSSQLAPFHSDAKQFHETLRLNIDAIKEAKERFSKELFDFSLLKGQLHKKILDQFQESLAKEYSEHQHALSERRSFIDHIEQKLASTLTLLSPLEKIPEQLRTINQEVARLSQESSRFVSQMESMVQHKLYLEKKIDSLEKLCATLRRRTTKP